MTGFHRRTPWVSSRSACRAGWSEDLLCRLPLSALRLCQAELDARVANLRRHLDALKVAEAAPAPDPAPAPALAVESEHQITATRATSSGVGGGSEQMGKGDRDEIADLRATLRSVTMREKERVEALQAQLEMARHELSESRSGRRIEQSALVTAESQATQLRAALACAEEDMKALRDALDQELLRGHRLQSRLMELDNTLHAHSLREKRDRPQAPSRSSASGSSRAPPAEDVSFDDYMSSRRREIEGSEKAAAVRPSSAKLGKSGGARAAGGRPRPVSAGNVAGQAKGDGGYRGTPTMDVVVSNRKSSVATDELRPQEERTAAPRQPSSSPPSASPAPAGGAGADGSVDSGGGGRERKRGKGQVDDAPLASLRSEVATGHVTKTSHLELRVEYCGRKSFSVRHKEEKYTLLAEQVKAAAYDRFKDRWMTVVTCNGEAPVIPGTAGAPKAADVAGHRKASARLGAFEMELFWTDHDGKKRRTVLHSKLNSRSFPKVAQVLDGLAEALDPAVLPEERL
jgi:hypothetical protein